MNLVSFPSPPLPLLVIFCSFSPHALARLRLAHASPPWLKGNGNDCCAGYDVADAIDFPFMSLDSGL